MQTPRTTYTDTAEPLRVLHVDTEMGWRGGQQQVSGLIEGMLKRGHRPLIVCRPGSAIDRHYAPRGLSQTVRMGSELNLCAALRIARIARECKAQIIHAHTARAHTLALFASKLYDVPVVVSRRVNFPMRHNFLNLQKYLAKNVTYVAVAHAVRASMIRWGIPQARIRVVHSGTDLSRFTDVAPDANVEQTLRQVPPGAQVIVTSCALDAQKDIPTLLHACALLRQRIPDTAFYLIVAGRGPILEQLEALRDELGLRDHVHFAGFVANIPALLSRANLFVLSTLSEGIGGSVLEAVASNIPVVASGIDGIPEIITSGENGFLAQPHSPDSMAQAMAYLLTRPDDARRMSEKAKMIFDNDFTLESMTEGNIRIYRELIG